MNILDSNHRSIQRSFFTGRAYTIIALCGSILTYVAHFLFLGSRHLGIGIESILWVSLGGSFILSFFPGIGKHVRLGLLQSNYFTFVVGTLLLAELNSWSIYFILASFLVVMLTFLTIRSIRGGILLSGVVMCLTSWLLFHPPLPEALPAPIILILIAVVVAGSMAMLLQRLNDEKKRYEGEIALQKSRRILSGVLESTNDYIWSMDRNYTLLAANPAFFRLMKLTHHRELRIGSPLPESFLSGYGHRDAYAKAFKGKQTSFTITLGSAYRQVFLEIRLHPIFKKGRIVAVSGFGRDVTNEINLRESHQQALERFDNAISATQDGIWEWDLEKRTFFITDKWEEILGYAPGEVSQKPEFFAQLIHPEDLEFVINTFRQHIKTGDNNLVGEFRMLHKNGSWIWLEGRGKAVRREDGWVLRISGAATDITQRKINELELKKLSLVASHTSNGVVITDANGIAEWANDGFSRISGYSKEELIGKRPGELLQGPETDPETRAYIASKVRAGESVSAEILNYHKDGHTYWLNMEINPIHNEDGELINWVGIESDISAQKENEAKLREAKEKAEDAARAKSDFLATMSHEIRTPMNAVIGMTGLLLDSHLNEEQREFVETIRISGDNLLTIINDILDFSKIDAGKMELEQQQFSLPETVEDVLDLLSSKAQAKGLELTYEAAGNVPSGLVSDPTRLNQVLVNLIGNAIKFTEEGEISLKIQEISRLQQVSQIQFSIRDTGIGIPKEKINLLFQPFSQVDNSATRKFGGTGLGLAISTKLVQLMGGRIWVESEPGKGSVFHFTIRVKVEGKDTFASYVAPAQKHFLEGKEALLVDDNQTNLRILSRQLQTWGINCLVVDDPRRAGIIVADKHFDLIILDMHMPHLSGTELAHEIRESIPEHPPMIMLTSLGKGIDPGDRDLFEAFLHKPVRREQLYKHIHRVLMPDHVQAEEEKEQKIIDHAELLPRLNVLIAEDNLVNQKVARRMLEKLGYQPEIVANGEEAVDILHHRRFDLIFMDMRMPVMDGLEATRIIRQSAKLYQPIICAMTANAMKGDREICLNAGMDDYITKPVKIQSIREAILRNFSQRGQLTHRSA